MEAGERKKSATGSQARVQGQVRFKHTGNRTRTNELDQGRALSVSGSLSESSGGEHDCVVKKRLLAGCRVQMLL